MAGKKKTGYTEPDDYFPKSVRKKNKLGEYAEDAKKQTPAKKKVKRK